MKHLTCAETAVLVRTALKLAFPGVTFSVVSKTYAGGASINVRWIDGPKADAVQGVAGAFACASFDPTSDLKTYQNSTLADGSPVMFGADYVFCTRKQSAATVAEARLLACQRWGFTPEDAVSPRWENWTSNQQLEDGRYMQNAAYREGSGYYEEAL